MNTVSDVLGNAGAPITATLSDGRVVTVRRLDQGCKTKVEQHLKGLARDQVMEDRHAFTDAEFQLAYGAFIDRVSSADFKFGGSIYERFLKSGSGGLFLTRMLCSVNGKDLSENDVIAITQHPDDNVSLTLAMKQAVAESFPKAAAPAHAPGTSAPAA
jgi:hypothetical protein